MLAFEQKGPSVGSAPNTLHNGVFWDGVSLAPPRTAPLSTFLLSHAQSPERLHQSGGRRGSCRAGVQGPSPLIQQGVYRARDAIRGPVHGTEGHPFNLACLTDQI